MCGIFCSLSGSSCHDNKHASKILETCLANLQNRGPDNFQSVPYQLPSGHKLSFVTSVLQTQGKKLCPQPYSYNDIIFCWNGDIFGGPLVKEIHSKGLCDTEVLVKHLSECLKQNLSPAHVLNEICGPYSFILFDNRTQTIWFGRDPAGRHSLLYGITDDPFNLTVSSVAHSSLLHMREVPALGLFEINLAAINDKNALCVHLHPWGDMDAEQLRECCESFPVALDIRSSACQQYIFRPLSTVCSEPNEEELKFFLLSFQDLSIEEKMKALSKVQDYHKNMMRVLSLLEQAVKVRIETNISLCQSCVSQSRPEESSCCHSKVAVLFSGGLDSAILARLVDKYVAENEPIDLLNVAFEKKKVYCNGAKVPKNGSNTTNTSISEDLPNDEDVIYNVPDRQSGNRSLNELQMLCPKRQWNFVEINVSAAELKEERDKCIGHLIHPLKTVLDDSLGCALWFAARGQGRIRKSNEIYKSPARIIISGMGADEQFGGYMRHRTTLKNNGWDALHKQLQLELKRIPSRNLGRDDRVISHHGRQPRMPFLDEGVISFVKSLSPWERCCPNESLPCGVGDKLLLRLAAWHLGLQGAAVLPKRAMQFGSRIANSKENAADTSDRL